MRHGLSVTLLLLIACQSSDRNAELAACQLISKSGDELAHCLVMKYSWRAESAGPAKTAWQWHLDSIRQEHDAQASAVLAQELAARRWRVTSQTKSFRSCVYRYVLAYNSGASDTARAREDESYLEATVRTCTTRFPDADVYGPLTQGFIDSLIRAGTSSRGP